MHWFTEAYQFFKVFLSVMNLQANFVGLKSLHSLVFSLNNCLCLFYYTTINDKCTGVKVTVYFKDTVLLSVDVR